MTPLYRLKSMVVFIDTDRYSPLLSSFIDERVCPMTDQNTDLREAVRARYAAAATAVTSGSSADCCGPAAVDTDNDFGGGRYSPADRDQLPAEAVAASLGCGNPTAVAELR